MDWRSLPSLSALRAFSALAQTGNFTRAGESLNVSHAAVSQHVRALESELGIALVIRNGKSCALTPDGSRLAISLEAAFSDIGDTIATLRGASDARPLQVTLTPAFAMRWLMPRISEFRQRHPEHELMLNPTAEVVDLLPGGVDVAIRFGHGKWPGLDAELLFPTTHAIVAARSLVGSRRIECPEDILDLPLLQEYGTNEMTLWLRNRGVIAPKFKNITHLPGYMALEGLMNGDGISAVARALVEPEISSGRLVVLFEDGDEESGYHIGTRPGVLRPAAKAFVRWSRNAAAGQNKKMASDRAPP